MLCCLADSFISYQMHSKAADFIRQIDGIQGAVRLIFRRLHVECEAPGFQFFYGGSNIGRADGDVAVFAQVRRLHQLHVFACEYGAVSLPDGQAKQGFKQGSTLSCLFGIEAENTDIDAGKIDHQGYISVARQLSERFGFRKVAITLRGSISASDNDWAAMLYENGEAVFSPTYRIHIVDRVGGGDSFGGGLIYSQLVGKSNQDAINFAVAASCLKHTIEHDFNLVSVAEVESLAGGNASGRVQR